MRPRGSTSAAAACAALAILVSAGPAAAAITPVANDASGAAMLGAASFADPSIAGAASFLSIPAAGAPHGIAGAPLGGFPTEGTQFAVLTTGSAEAADDPNANVPDSGGSTDDVSSDLFDLGDRGNTSQDETVLALPFTAPPTSNCLTFDFRFLSEEFADFVGLQFNDAFIAELDASTWSVAGSAITAPGNFAFDAAGNVVSVNSSGVTQMSAAEAAGTTYDGATQRLSASTQLAPGAHTLFLSIFDQGDGILDSAAFVDNIRVGFVPDPAVNCRPGARPALFQLALTPATANKDTGDTHTVTAEVLDDDGAPVAGAPVAFRVTGANGTTGTGTTDTAGKASFAYTGAAAGDDLISACYDADADGACEATDSAMATWSVRNLPPDCGSVTTSVATLKAQGHRFKPVTLSGATDGDGDALTYAITGVTQDEATNGLGDGDTPIDAMRTDDPATILLRAERSGTADGRVYEIAYTVSDGQGGSCTGTALVGVPHDESGAVAVDSGVRFNSLS